MYQNDPMKVLTGECRLSYVNVVTPRAPVAGGEAKYSVTLLIPKSDTVTKADIDSSMGAAATEAITKTWNGVQPPNLRVPIYDGDGVRPSGEPFGEECRGHWVITASTKIKPQVVGAGQPRRAGSDHQNGLITFCCLTCFQIAGLAAYIGIVCACNRLKRPKQIIAALAT